MFTDFLSLNNYAQYNIKVAHIIGLKPAVYLNELLNINERAVRKSKMVGDSFKIDRKYIESVTTIPKDEQLSIDEILMKLGIIRKTEDPEIIFIDVNSLLSITSMSTEEIEKFSVLYNSINKEKPKRLTQKQKDIFKLKDLISVTNRELKDAYDVWIDSVYAKQGWMSVKSVTMGQKLVDEYCDHNLDLALLIIDIAASNGYRDIQWAINKYESEYRVHYNIPKFNKPVPQVTPELGAEIF